MSGPVREIRATEPNPKLVNYLEELLADARAGEVVGIVGVAIFENRDTGPLWIPPPAVDRATAVDGDRILGALERLKFELLAGRYQVELEDHWRGGR